MWNGSGLPKHYGTPTVVPGSQGSTKFPRLWGNPPCRSLPGGYIQGRWDIYHSQNILQNQKDQTILTAKYILYPSLSPKICIISSIGCSCNAKAAIYCTYAPPCVPPAKPVYFPCKQVHWDTLVFAFSFNTLCYSS